MDVKVGDTILIVTNSKETLGTVTKVTPAGSFKVDCFGDALFTKNGDLKGGGVWCTTKAFLADKEDIARVKNQRVIHGVVTMCHNLKDHELSYEQAVAIYKILRPSKEEE